MKHFLKINNYMYLIIVCLFRIILDDIYINIVSPMYNYAGMTVNFSNERLILSWVMTIIYSIFLMRIINLKKCGATIISVLLLCSAIPTSTVYAYLPIDQKFVILNLIYWFLIVNLYLIFSSRKKRYSLILGDFKVSQSKKLLYFAFAYFSICVFYIALRYTGFHINFNLLNVYSTRSSFEEINLPVILQYSFSASIMVFPIILIYGLRSKNVFVSIIALFMQLLAFAADGRKSTLFVLIITLGGFYFIKDFSSKYFPIAMLLLVSIGYLETFILKTTYFINIFVRRLLLLPAYLQYAYYDFFKSNPKDLFSQSILRRLGFSSPYLQKIQNVIGDRYYLGSYANNGMFADAYSNLGNLGVIFLPLMIVFALVLLDRMSDRLPMGMCIGIIFVSSYTLLSSSFFAVMLTHGFLFGCIIIYLVPRTKNELINKLN